MKHTILLAVICISTMRLSAQNTWNLDGNFVAPGQFLGSTNFVPVDIKAGNMRVLRLEPDARTNVGGLSGNLIGGFINNAIEQPGSGGNVIMGGGFPAGPNIIHSNSQGVFIGAGSAHQIGPFVNDAVIVGGFGNDAGAYNAFIGSGRNNRVVPYGDFSSVVGGERNTNGGWTSLIGGGFNNLIQSNAFYSTIAGGLFNTVAAPSTGSAIGGGDANTVTGFASTVPGGYFNAAFGDYSFAAGQQASALHPGAFVWADSQNANFASTGPDQFLVRAAGGMGLNTTTPIAGLHILKESVSPGGTLALEGETHTFMTFFPHTVPVARRALVGFLVPRTPVFSISNEFGRGNIALLPGPGGNVGIGTATPAQRLHVIGNILASGTITANSDRNAKTAVTSVDPAAMLERVVKLPIRQWRFKAEEEGIKHVGPMAQDFHAAFGLGEQENAIATVDADGVALAAIQGLNQKLTRELQRRDTENAELRRELAELRDLVKSVRQDFAPRER